MYLEVPAEVRKFAEFAKGVGLVLTQYVYDPENFGNQILNFGGKVLNVAIVKDRGDWFVDAVERRDGASHQATWLPALFGLAVDLSRPQSLADQLEIVEVHWAKLVAAFSPALRASTLARLSELARDRANEVGKRLS